MGGKGSVAVVLAGEVVCGAGSLWQGTKGERELVVDMG